MKTKKTFLSICIVLLVGTVLSSARTEQPSPKSVIHQEPSQTKENALLSLVKSSPSDVTRLTNLAEYYFWVANYFDRKYFWGNPRKVKENGQKAYEYSIKAIENYERAISIDGKNPDLYARLAESYGLRMRNGSLGEKMRFMGKFKSNLEKALEIDPENFEALITQAFKTLYSPSLFVNRNKSAKEQFEHLLKGNPDNHEIYKGLAIVHQRMDENEKALQLINKSLELDSGDLEALGIKGEIEAQLKKQGK